MATYSQTYEENLRRTIRDIKALDPLITNVGLTEKLSKHFNHSFDPRYIKKLSSKVDRQVMVEADRAKIEERSQGELDQVVALYNQQLARFKGDVPAACKLIQADAKSATNAPDRAAWTVVANVLLNLDETISKE